MANRTVVCSYCGKTFEAELHRIRRGRQLYCSCACSARAQGVGTEQRRLWSKIDKNGPIPEHRPDLGACWVWTAATTNGYGYLQIGGRQGRRVQAYKLAYEWLVGPVPAGLQLDHLCRNRRCVNPSHLEPVTQLENLLRGNHPMMVLHRIRLGEGA